MDATAPDYSSELSALRTAFLDGRTRPAAWRLAQLRALEKLLDDNEARLLEALKTDLGKPEQEALLELSVVRSELRHAKSGTRRWMKPRRVATPVVGLPAASWICPEPLGVVLVMSAWNYPVQLLLTPLVTVLAAGNAAMLKPSEIAATTSRLLAELAPQYLDGEAVRVIEGGVPETTALLEEHFDHIVYTGSGHVGRIVMTAAAKHLTPVTLELGGKSPCVVDRDADLDGAARRLVWGKCLNAGQTCIAPDYVLVHRDRRDALVDKLREHLAGMYGGDVLASPDYARIIHAKHYERLRAFLDDGRVVIGGHCDDERCMIEPTVLVDVDAGAPVMREEIFGPVLPVIAVDDLDAALDFILKRDKPLAAYLFTKSARAEKRFVETVSAGSLCINDTLMFMTVPDLPFGGVGPSGMGQYKGGDGFRRLSHMKAVMRRGRWPEISLRFPPYTKFKERLFRWLT